MDSFWGNWLVTNLKHSNGNDNTVLTATVETARSVYLNESGILKTNSHLLAVVVTKIANTVSKWERMILTVGFLDFSRKNSDNYLHEQPCVEGNTFMRRGLVRHSRHYPWVMRREKLTQ